jgi:hypothetical protein
MRTVLILIASFLGALVMLCEPSSAPNSSNITTEKNPTTEIAEQYYSPLLTSATATRGCTSTTRRTHHSKYSKLFTISDSYIPQSLSIVKYPHIGSTALRISLVFLLHNIRI